MVMIPRNPKDVFKTFMVVAETFACPAACPYCTAQITAWPQQGDMWENFDEQVKRAVDAGVKFEYITFSGNGEPSLQKIETIQMWKDTAEKYKDSIGYIRLQTCGHIFSQQGKWEILKEDVFEITRYDLNPAMNGHILGMVPYDELETFKRSKVIMNLVLRKDRVDHILEDIESIQEQFPNVIGINLKILNVNTFDEKDLQSEQSQWILKHGIQKNQEDKIEQIVSSKLEKVLGYDDFKDRYEWLTDKGITVYLYARRKPYGISNVVYYNGSLVDYSLEQIEFGDEDDSGLA